MSKISLTASANKEPDVQRSIITSAQRSSKLFEYDLHFMYGSGNDVDSEKIKFTNTDFIVNTKFHPSNTMKSVMRRSRKPVAGSELNYSLGIDVASVSPELSSSCSEVYCNMLKNERLTNGESVMIDKTLVSVILLIGKVNVNITEEEEEEEIENVISMEEEDVPEKVDENWLFENTENNTIEIPDDIPSPLPPEFTMMEAEKVTPARRFFPIYPDGVPFTATTTTPAVKPRDVISHQVPDPETISTSSKSKTFVPPSPTKPVPPVTSLNEKFLDADTMVAVAYLPYNLVYPLIQDQMYTEEEKTDEKGEKVKIATNILPIGLRGLFNRFDKFFFKDKVRGDLKIIGIALGSLPHYNDNFYEDLKKFYTTKNTFLPAKTGQRSLCVNALTLANKMYGQTNLALTLYDYLTLGTDEVDLDYDPSDFPGMADLLKLPNVYQCKIKSNYFLNSKHDGQSFNVLCQVWPFETEKQLESIPDFNVFSVPSTWQQGCINSVFPGNQHRMAWSFRSVFVTKISYFPAVSKIFYEKMIRDSKNLRGRILPLRYYDCWDCINEDSDTVTFDQFLKNNPDKLRDLRQEAMRQAAGILIVDVIGAADNKLNDQSNGFTAVFAVTFNETSVNEVTKLHGCFNTQLMSRKGGVSNLSFRFKIQNKHGDAYGFGNRQSWMTLVCTLFSTSMISTQH